MQFIRHAIATSTLLIFSSATAIFSFSASAQSPVRNYQPIPTGSCNQLRQDMAKILRTNVAMSRAAFQDFMSQEQGMACQLIATGNGYNFKKVYEIVDDLNTMLVRQGWKPQMTYVADGPTEAARGFRKGNRLIVLNVAWEPSADANCPDDEPISACQLSPEQQLYRITLNAARQ